MTEYYWGLLAGVFFAVLLFVLVGKALKIRRLHPEYDERQVAAQGKAFKLAFFTLVAWCAVYGLLDAFGVRWCDTAGTGLFMGIIVSAGVYAVTAVCKDAYFGYNENGKTALFLGLIGLMNLVACVMILVSGEGRFIEDGLLQSTPTLNLACALLFAVLLTVDRVHGKRAAVTGEGEE